MKLKFIDEKKYHRLFCACMILACLLLANMSLHAQGIQITGVVSDERGIAFPGVNVVEKGTMNGVATGPNGDFALMVAGSNAVLQFSYIGYNQLEIPVGNTRRFQVAMTEMTSQMEEVVVVGYGSMQRRDVTGSVASVTSEALMAKAPLSVEQALKGQVAGVLIAQGSGFDSSPTIRIRGNRSIGASNDPLFVVDGVPIWGNMDNINPADIQSIEVLKDASATAIYGVRGANGVILVTTKKGEEGRVSVDYQGFTSFGFQNSRFRKVRDAAQYVEFVRDANREYIYDGQGGYMLDPTSAYKSESPSYEDDMNMTYFTNDPSGYILYSLQQGWTNNNTVYDPSKLREFDWQMAGYRDAAITQNHSVSVRAGSQNTRVLISGSYLDQSGITLRSENTRYTLRLNLDQTIGKHASVGGNINFSHSERFNGMTISTSYTPLASPYYSPGGSGNNGVGGDVSQPGDPALGLIPSPGGELLQVNPFYNIEGRQAKDKMSRISNAIYAQLTFIEGLTYRINFGADLYIRQNQGWWSSFSTEARLGDSRANQDFTFDRNWTLENIVSYKKTFNNDHSVDLTLMQSAQRNINEPATISVLGLPIEEQLWYDLGKASTKDVTSNYTERSLLSWMGRLNYSYKGKYIATVTTRWDGASQLAQGHKWATFPAVSLAWRISEENFFKDASPLINNLKLRAGYGRTGQSSVQAYSTMGQIASSRYTWGKSSPFLGYAPSTLSSPYLDWEYTDQFNIGVDMSMLKGRISAVLELYQQKTSNLLLIRSLPRVTGFSNITENIGATENKGFELGINSINIKNKNIEWSTNFQFATNQEKITQLNNVNDPRGDIGNSWFFGKPIDTYFDYIATPVVWGYSKTDMDEIAKFNANGTSYRPGDLRLVDLNGDYRITQDDRDFRGQKMPKVTLSMANTFRYKQFDLYVFMYSMLGQTISWDPGVGYAARYNTYMVDYWTPANTNTRWLKPHQGMEMPANDVAMYYWDGNFLKINDITLGYSLPTNLMQKIGIKSLRIYAKVQNPFIFTPFIGQDPEGAVATRRSGTNNLTLSRYTSDSNTLTTYQFGLNISFK